MYFTPHSDPKISVWTLHSFVLTFGSPNLQTLIHFSMAIFVFFFCWFFFFRFTKNLSPDKINVSTFRGEGDLSNLQLDENVLTELLELPSWIRLTSAWCNHVSFRITWTKLKSVPIILVNMKNYYLTIGSIFSVCM